MSSKPSRPGNYVDPQWLVACGFADPPGTEAIRLLSCCGSGTKSLEGPLRVVAEVPPTAHHVCLLLQIGHTYEIHLRLIRHPFDSPTWGAGSPLRYRKGDGPEVPSFP